MKPDDRDIVCEQNYTPLSDAELVAAIERYAAIMHSAPLVNFDLEWITGPARALLARVKAAEAERDDANIKVALEQANAREAWHAFDRQQSRGDRLAARVAELEAQIAAQQWRPVTEDWPPYNERVIIGHGGGYGGGWCVFARRVRTDDRDGDDWLMDDDMTLAFESAVVAMQRPLPPAPQETE